MARARLLKPGFFTNDVLAELPATGRILFAGLWTLADREGRLEDRPRKIKAEVLPYDDDDVDAMLARLEGLGFLARYEHRGIRYIQITNFGKHQSPHVKEPASVIPAPDEPDAGPVLAPDEPDASPSSRAHSPIPHSLNHNHNHNPIPEADLSAPSAAVPETITNISELTEERPQEMVAAFCASIGADVRTQAPAWVGKQRAVAKRMLEQGYTIEKVVACAGFRQSQTWRDEPFDLFDIEKGIGKWEAAGSPPRAKGRASPNGRGPITTSDTFLVNGKEPDDEQRKRYDEADRLAFERAKQRAATEARL